MFFPSILFQKNVHSKVFLSYICNHVLPGLGRMSPPVDGVDVKLDMLKLLAEISEHNGFTPEDCKMPLQNVFERLIVSTFFLH